MKIDTGRKLYSLKEIYKILYNGVRTVPFLSKAKKKGELDQEFIERIMLAVTEVNGCVICSYAHTRMALEAGMSNEEIQEMLSGSTDRIPDDQIQAVMFAQHYADTRGNPSKETWERIRESYGPTGSSGILGAVRIIMMGNALGIPWSSFLNRFKGRSDKRSTLLYEIGVMVLGSLLIPVAMVHAFASYLFRVKIIDFK